MSTPLRVDARMQLDHPTWVLGSFPAFALAYTKDHYCPSYTLTNELVKKAGTNNNLHFLLVEFPHVTTAETADDPHFRLTSVSDEWKPSPPAPGTLPSLPFAPLYHAFPCAIQRKVKHPPADRASVVVTTLFPPPNQKHLWSNPATLPTLSCT